MTFDREQLALGTGDERVLLQEKLRGDPWRMLVGCILLNLTSRRAVEAVIWELFRRWPDAPSLAAADAAEVEGVLRPLGLHRRRALALVRFSREWAEDPGLRPVTRYHGIGQYAADSWAIFQEGEAPDPPPSGDWALTAYVTEGRAAGKRD